MGLTLGGEDVARQANGRLVAAQLDGVEILVGWFAELGAQVIEPGPGVVDEQQGDNLARSRRQIRLVDQGAVPVLEPRRVEKPSRLRARVLKLRNDHVSVVIEGWLDAKPTLGLLLVINIIRVTLRVVQH